MKYMRYTFEPFISFLLWYEKDYLDLYFLNGTNSSHFNCTCVLYDSTIVGGGGGWLPPTMILFKPNKPPYPATLRYIRGGGVAGVRPLKFAKHGLSRVDLGGFRLKH